MNHFPLKYSTKSFLCAEEDKMVYMLMVKMSDGKIYEVAKGEEGKPFFYSRKAAQMVARKMNKELPFIAGYAM